ncbi:MAG: iron-containing alcohol dehydrogenase [Armatimonadota bacterium]|nr:iron-containing alcohol dehydrogenase [bacterium]
MSSEITSPAIIYSGAGSFSKTVSEAARLGTSAAVVLGQHLQDTEVIAGLLDNLHTHDMKAVICDPITTEPTVEMVDSLAGTIKRMGVDVVIAVGGGSVMDTAKAAAVMAVNDGLTEDYQLKRREIVNPPQAQVFVPTTAGTGSEATRVSVLTNERAGVKRSISHPLMTPNAVILDPQLTVSLSKYLTTLTAMDAFAHAIESAVSRNATSYTRHIALAGIEQLSAGLPACQSSPDDLNARLMCLEGSCFAGLAMQSGLGASHSLAPAVCIVTGIRHSEAVAALLPHAIRLNESHSHGTYDLVSRAMDCSDVASRLEELCRLGGFNVNLAQFGLCASDWKKVCEVMNRYGSHRKTNPVEVTDAYAEEIFLAAVS